MLHGWGGSKTNFESTSPTGGIQQQLLRPSGIRGSQLHRSRLRRLLRRSAAAGPFRSLRQGLHPSRRHALRGARHPVPARPARRPGHRQAGAIGVTGVSYGGGQSMELAFLNDRIRRPDGTLAPWRSPNGKALRIAAAYPRWPWSDLVDALLPNGRFLDTQVAPRGQSLNPVGVPIQSYISGLFALGSASGYYCGTAPASTPCTDRDANLPLGLRPDPGGQAALRGRPGRHPQHLQPQQRLRPRVPGRRLEARAPADPKRLDGRPVPGPARPPPLQPPSLALPGLPGQPPVRGPRPQPRLEQGGHERGLLRPGGAVLRRLPEATVAAPRRVAR